MVDRRVSMVVSGMLAFVALAALWSAFVRPARRVKAGSVPDAPVVAVPSESTATGAPPVATPAPVSPAPAPAPAATVVPGADAGGPSYIVLLARSEIRRRIRASAGLTYLNEVVAAAPDSTLHRWDDRLSSPVRVYLPSATVANFQPAFLDQVRSAFARWEAAGVPVRFALDADSATAEVKFQWRIQFEGERTGQTDLQWDDDGRLTSGVVTLATFDPKGQPLAPDDVHVMAMHEIGHLIGLDHSPDAGDIMYATPKVRDLSGRDIATALLLYQLSPGPLRVGR
ncbi:MAG TPA: matrixin family metalloprotease [Gemmatimonadales bacterium]|nr:matrixin family metalloprotease [Gemmatimonadales bacterium]